MHKRLTSSGYKMIVSGFEKVKSFASFGFNCPSLHDPPSLPYMNSIRRTTVEIGTAFELHTQRFLNQVLCMDLDRVGGAGDGGIDLRGWWWLPAPNTSAGGIRRLRVLAQCKAEAKPISARALRELEGVTTQHTDSTSAKSTISVLASQAGFTRLAMEHATKSKVPILMVHLPGGQPGTVSPLPMEVQGAYWNAALGGPRGILAGEMELRRIIFGSGRDPLTAETSTKSTVSLLYRGRPFTRIEATEDDEMTDRPAA